MQKHEIEFLFFGMWIGGFIVKVLCIFVAWNIDRIRQLLCHHVDAWGMTLKQFKDADMGLPFNDYSIFHCNKCGMKKKVYRK